MVCSFIGRLNLKHIFASPLLKSCNTMYFGWIAGMRSSSDVIIYLDAKKALEGGLVCVLF